MDKGSLASVAFAAGLVVLGVALLTAVCFGCCSAVEMAPPATLLGFMALGVAGMALGRPAVAWSGVILAVSASFIMGLSWGGLLLLPSLGLLAAALVWRFAGRSTRPRRRMAPAAIAPVLSLPLG